MESGCSIKVLRIDGGGNFISTKLGLFCKKKDRTIKYEALFMHKKIDMAIKYVAPYVHKENGLAEQE